MRRLEEGSGVDNNLQENPEEEEAEGKEEVVCAKGFRQPELLSCYSGSASDSDSAPTAAPRARLRPEQQERAVLRELRAPGPHTAAEINTEGQQPWNSSRSAVASLAEQSCGCAVAVYKRAAPVLRKYQRASALGGPPKPPPPPPSRG
jgi:hypothetical protein